MLMRMKETHAHDLPSDCFRVMSGTVSAGSQAGVGFMMDQIRCSQPE